MMPEEKRMDEKETLQSIAVCFQKKYNGFVEMESITKHRLIGSSFRTR